MSMRGSFAVLALVATTWGCGTVSFAERQPQPQEARWFRGNLHTHTLWSDGDDYPEMVGLWYRSHGYDFLVITDHNVVPRGERWIAPARTRGGLGAYRRYVEAFGDDWVEERWRADTFEVRLRTLEEIRQAVEIPGRFLVIAGEELSQAIERRSVHANGINLAEEIPQPTGESPAEILQKGLEAVRAQSTVERPTLFHLNHPNFQWGVSARDMAAVRELRFFEVFNGHPLTRNEGDAEHPGTERLWDLTLVEQIRRGEQLLYGVATDDAHYYFVYGPREVNPGRGWVQVRARDLSARAIIEAMERGDFYASTGVELDDIRFEDGRLSLRIRAEPGVEYRTRFIGTRAGAVQASSFAAPAGDDGIGVVLAEVAGTTPSYRFQGDELYVRATVLSTKPRVNPETVGATASAWVQPVRGPGRL